MDARFLQADDLAALRAEATRAAAEGADAVFLREGPLGDPLVLAAGLGSMVPGLLLGARITLTPTGRHPAMLAREATSLDLVCGGRSVLCFAPPFSEDLPEAIALCRALWRAGEVISEGPRFPVHAAADRARPVAAGSPLVALDLTADGELPPFLAGAADLVLRPGNGPAAVCRLERV